MSNDESNVYIDTDYYQVVKNGERISGDMYLLSRSNDSKQLVCTLSDGLGSGVKANVLSSLTANMAEKMMFSTKDIKKSAETILGILPICKERGIGYATCTIADMKFLTPEEIKLTIVEYDNPSLMYFKGSEYQELSKKETELHRSGAFKKEILYESVIYPEVGDRIILFTDGVTQSGLGKTSNLGWGCSGVKQFVKEAIERDRDISSRSLAKEIVLNAKKQDDFKPQDDITAVVIHIRNPRRTMVITGPPFTEDNDVKLLEKIKSFNGKIVVSGGTTSQIVSRLLEKPLKVDLTSVSKTIPPSSNMDGIDLVTEGMITLNAVATVLEEKQSVTALENNAVKKMVRLLLDSDRIHFVVGTKINEAQHDPRISFEMGIRRTVVGRIRKALEENFIKETTLEYL